MEHKPLEVKERSSFWEEKNQKQAKMDLKCPCLGFMTNGERSRLAGWAPWEERKGLNIRLRPLLARGQPQDRCGECERCGQQEGAQQWGQAEPAESRLSVPAPLFPEQGVNAGLPRMRCSHGRWSK